MNIFKTALFSILTLGGLLGCNTDDGSIECVDDFTGELAANEQLLVGTWVLTAINADQEVDLTDDGEDNASQDIFAQYEDCQRDAQYMFQSSRAYSFEQGQNTTTCPTSLSTSGTWQLSGQTLSLTSTCTLQSTGLEFDSGSTQFSSSNILNIVDVFGNTIQSTVTFVYTKS